MKKMTTTMMAMLLFLAISVSAETVVKFGLGSTFGKVEEFNFSFLSAEIRVEQSLYKNFGLGFGIRKETEWLYNGYYLILYPTYKIKFSKRYFSIFSIGVEYGVATFKYNYYKSVYDEAGNLIKHKWIYLMQNALIPFDSIKKTNIGTIYPFAAVSCGAYIWKGFFVEAGMEVKMMKFKVESCQFDPETWTAYNVQNKKRWVPTTSISIQIGYKF